MTEQRIGPDTQVTLHFALSLESGEQVDTTFDKQPATFKVGDGNLLPGFGRQAHLPDRPGAGVRSAQPAKRANHAA